MEKGTWFIGRAVQYLEYAALADFKGDLEMAEDFAGMARAHCENAVKVYAERRREQTINSQE